MEEDSTSKDKEPEVTAEIFGAAVYAAAPLTMIPDVRISEFIVEIRSLTSFLQGDYRVISWNRR